MTHSPALFPLAHSLGVTVVSIGVAAGLVSPAAAQEPESRAPVLYTDTITVTANKRPQLLGDVDGSISVRTGDDLDAAGPMTCPEN